MFVITEHFYTLQEAAEAIGRERHSIARWIREGKIQAQKAGGVVFIEKSVIDALRKEQVA